MGEKRPNEFPYDPLTPTSIRLLRLSRSNSNSTSITGILSIFSLDALPSIGFTTLSYVWGEKRYHPHTITLNDRPFSVLESVYSALETICDTPELRKAEWWWIDSICIDQANDPCARRERSHQIQLMGTIYRDSKETIVWLGERHEDSDEAIEFLKVLARKKDWLKPNRNLNQLGDANLLDKDKWKSVERILMRPWWTRVWTLQEFIIPSKLTFYCGSKGISRGVVGNALLSMDSCRRLKFDLIHTDTFLPAWNRRRLWNWYEHPKGGSQRMGLIALMAYMGNCQATDGRDRIYSLLGLAGDGELAGVLDYEASIEEIYCRLVVSFVRMYRSLDIICFADLFHGNEDEKLLPSWVPDWRTNVVPFVVALMASQSSRSHIGNFRPLKNLSLVVQKTAEYAAAGSSLPGVKFSKDLRVLTCKAILIDQIDGLGGTYTKKGIQEYVQSTSPINSRSRTEGVDQISLDQDSALLNDIVRSLVLDREDRNLNYPTPITSFRSEFQQLCTIAMDDPKAVSSRFCNWFQPNKDLLIRGHTLETLTGTTRASRPPKPPGTKFLQRLQDTVGPYGMARRLITTDKGYIGMVSRRARKGDLVCVLFGCSIPVVLRKFSTGCSENSKEDSYEFIGECYLHGFMNGEALENERSEVQGVRLL
jgi:hypothetical protein